MTTKLVDEIEVIARTAVWLAKENWQLKAISIPTGPKGRQRFSSVSERKEYLISTLKKERCRHDGCEFPLDGPDIIAERSEVCLKVECKGLGEGKPSTLRNNFDRALASAVSYYDCLEGIHLGLAFPEDNPEYQKNISSRLPDALRKKLNIWIFLLSEDRLNVKAFPPEEKPGFVKPKPSKKKIRTALTEKEKVLKALTEVYGEEAARVGMAVLEEEE